MFKKIKESIKNLFETPYGSIRRLNLEHEELMQRWEKCLEKLQKDINKTTQETLLNRTCGCKEKNCKWFREEKDFIYELGVKYSIKNFYCTRLPSEVVLNENRLTCIYFEEGKN